MMENMCLHEKIRISEIVFLKDEKKLLSRISPEKSCEFSSRVFSRNLPETFLCKPGKIARHIKYVLVKLLLSVIYVYNNHLAKAEAILYTYWCRHTSCRDHTNARGKYFLLQDQNI